MSDALKLTRVRRLAASGEARRLRRAANLSYAETGSAVAVSPATILRWETGERSPHGAAALRYLELLDQLADLEATADAG
jgi:DNA-binding transcriptional regulator YiaG